MTLKSEALEAKHSWTQTFIYMTCPYCQESNTLNLGNMEDVTVSDIQACQCHACSKKFWLDGNKELYEDEVGFGLDEQDDLIQDRGKDLIEHAYYKVGMSSKSSGE